MAQGLPGSLMYVLYEELCTQAWCSQDLVGFLGNYGPNMGTKRIRNLPTMYSEAEPGSRAGGASEGHLPVIPHQSPSACSQPWDSHKATACPARTVQPMGSRGCRLRSGSCAVPTSTLPRGCCCSWCTLRRKTQTQEPQTLDAAPSGGQACQGSVAQAPPTSTLSIMFTAQLSVSAVLLNAHFYTFLKYFLQSFYTVISIWIYIITRCDPIEMYVIMVCLLQTHMPQLSPLCYLSGSVQLLSWHAGKGVQAALCSGVATLSIHVCPS